MDPDIPVLKRKEEEKKGGLPPIGRSTSAPGGSILGRLTGFGRAANVGVMGSGAAGRGFLPSLINFVTSRFGMTLALSVAGASAVMTIYSLGMGAMHGGFQPQRHGFSFGSQSAASGSEVAAPASPVSSLDMAAVSNKNFFEGGSAPAAVNKPVIEPEPPQAAPPADPTADAARAVEQAAQAEKPKMVGAPQGFGAGRMSGSPGAGAGLAGGRGLSDGMVRMFSPNGPGGGVKSLQAMRPGPKTSVVQSRSMRPAQRSSSALRQLRFANIESQRARGASASESQSYHAENAFAPAAGAAGPQTAGAGISQGTKGPSVGEASEGPITQGSNTPGEKAAPGVGKGEDVSPWTKSVMLAMSLLMSASLIVTAIGILGMFKMLPVVGSLAAMAQMILLGMATAMAATASSLGVMIISKYGQTLQGGILTAGGAITTAAAIFALMVPGGPSWPLVLGGIAGIVTAIGSLMSSAKMPGGPFR